MNSPELNAKNEHEITPHLKRQSENEAVEIGLQANEIIRELDTEKLSQFDVAAHMVNLEAMKRDLSNIRSEWEGATNMPINKLDDLISRIDEALKPHIH